MRIRGRRRRSLEEEVGVRDRRSDAMARLGRSLQSISKVNSQRYALAQVPGRTWKERGNDDDDEDWW